MTPFDSDPPSKRDADAPDKASAPADVDGAQLLDLVLQETLGGESDADDQAVFQGLLDIRRRRPDECFTVVPVAAEMVSVALNHRLGQYPWGSLPQIIAKTLGDDQVSRQRLEALWDRLLDFTGES